MRIMRQVVGAIVAIALFVTTSPARAQDGTTPDLVAPSDEQQAGQPADNQQAAPQAAEVPAAAIVAQPEAAAKPAEEPPAEKPQTKPSEDCCQKKLTKAQKAKAAKDAFNAGQKARCESSYEGSKAKGVWKNGTCNLDVINKERAKAGHPKVAFCNFRATPDKNQQLYLASECVAENQVRYVITAEHNLETEVNGDKACLKRDRGEDMSDAEKLACDGNTGDHRKLKDNVVATDLALKNSSEALDTMHALRAFFGLNGECMYDGGVYSRGVELQGLGGCGGGLEFGLRMPDWLLEFNVNWIQDQRLGQAVTSIVPSVSVGHMWFDEGRFHVGLLAHVWYHGTNQVLAPPPGVTNFGAAPMLRIELNVSPSVVFALSAYAGVNVAEASNPTTFYQGNFAAGGMFSITYGGPILNLHKDEDKKK